ncbi:hypothetical protein ACFX2C_004681 [Malus domestica]
MMRRRSDAKGRAGDSIDNMAQSSTSRDEEVAWEMRPGGMLVQQRGEKSDAPAPNFCLRISFGALRYEMSASAQSTFGKNDLDLTFRILCFVFCFLILSGSQENGGKL